MKHFNRFLLLTTFCLTLFFTGTSRAQFSPVPIPQPPKSLVPPSVPFVPLNPKTPTDPVTKARAKMYEEMLKELRQREKEAAEQEKKIEEFLAKLFEEFGPGARIGFSRHFVVVYDTTDAYANWCARVLETVAFAYERFVSGLDFSSGLEDPMVVFIYAEKERYEDYFNKYAPSELQRSKVKPLGFYSSKNNRAVFYDLTDQERNRLDKTERRSIEEVATEVLAAPKGRENLSTIVHEGTHLVSYNYGLFSRQGENPQWAVEGLAMLFEAPCGEAKDGGWYPFDKGGRLTFATNKQRVAEFKNYASGTIESPFPVKDVVGLEQIDPERDDAYPISWALFSFLYKKYPRYLKEYLLYNVMQQPRMGYATYQRTREFELCFAYDWNKLFLELRAHADALELEDGGMDPKEAEAVAREKYNLPKELTPEEQKRQARAEREAKRLEAEAARREKEASWAAQEAEKKAQASEERAAKAARKAQEAERSTGRKLTPDAKPSKGKKTPDAKQEDWLKGWDEEG